MDLTREQMIEMCKSICPHCEDDRPLRQRVETAEWVHDFAIGTKKVHTLCFANHFRKKHRGVLNG